MNSFMLNALVFIALLGFCATMPSKTLQDASNGHIKTLKYSNSIGEIVKDLVTNWNSPILYLRNRGYITAPRIDSDMFKKDVDKAESKDAKRMARSNEYENTNDLNHLFRTLFSTNDDSISDKIRSRLGVAWDVDKLKTTVHNEAHKYYEQYLQVPTNHKPEGNTDVDKQVAQLYPSVIAKSSNDHAEKEEKKEVIEPTSLREQKFLSGIAKLLTNRELMGFEKPLPLQQEKSRSLV